MKLVSPAFACGEALPVDFTRHGANLSPALAWSELPTSTVTLALTCADPDASRLWYHWVIWNIPPHWTGLPQRFPRCAELQGLRQGTTSYRTLGFDGPEPPPGESHRYIFRLYALDRRLNLAAGAPAPQLERAMDGKVLATAGIKGLYTSPERSLSW
ncbi:MAG: YbhB/YbcL family Raf kinase inhibitor-like protein [Candidatus Melainabacteria bacterium HGW-Melainabacteria-1]|nr:MAG: YbhB/YbcL family Raf kinase inhibitor-like protein [Candidatus Melainabacteria bacterium HGW-Melainabacteria-1]